MSAGPLHDTARVAKPVKTLFGWLLFRRISAPLSIAASRTPVRPSHVTALGVALGVAAGVALSTGRTSWQVAAAGMAIVAKILDAMDGEIARIKHLDTPAGYVADGLSDRVRDTAIILGMGLGLSRAGDASALSWTLAAVTGYLAFFYVSGAFPAHWREVRRPDDIDEKHMFRVTPSIRLGAGDTLIVLLTVAALTGRLRWLLIAIAVGSPAAVALKVRSLFARRPWERA